METYRVYLFQYKKGKELKRRFYGHKELFHPDSDELMPLLTTSAKNVKNEPLEKIIEIIEKDTLEARGFVNLTGLRRVLSPQTYKSLVSPHLSTYNIRVGRK